MPQKQWNREEFLTRVRRLRQQGFTSEEAWDMASWSHDLSHWVVTHLRNDRRALLRSWKLRGMSDDEIGERLTQRYIDLGITGQYQDEEWYVNRVGA